MSALPPLYYASPRGQCAIMLVAALHERYVIDGIRNSTKQEVVQFISLNRWFDVQDEDRTPYPSHEQLSREPRWHTLIAWARKDGVIDLTPKKWT